MYLKKIFFYNSHKKKNLVKNLYFKLKELSKLNSYCLFYKFLFALPEWCTIPNLLTLLLGKFLRLCFLQFRYPGGRFTAKKTTTPVTSDLIVPIVEVGLDCFNDFGEVGSIA